LLTNFAKATISQKKRALKEAALESSKNFLDLFEALLKADKPYDVKADPAGMYVFRNTLREVAKNHPFQIAQLKTKSQPELVRVVEMIIGQFKELVEKKDLSKLLWNGTSPRNEKAAQLLFYAVAEAYCNANNIDIAPEANMGGGPVDFKFSRGGDNRFLVEIKLSTGRVVHGYEKQLEVYRAASSGCDAAFLIINVGKMGIKLARIKKIQTDRRKENGKAADIHVVDAGRRPSASVRI
jgi:hypothetical protein